MSARLTRRQRNFLQALFEYISKHGISPTTSELARHLGVHRNSAIAMRDRLERMGWVRVVRDKHTTITPVFPDGIPHVLDRAREKLSMSIFKTALDLAEDADEYTVYKHMQEISFLYGEILELFKLWRKEYEGKDNSDCGSVRKTPTGTHG